MHTWTNLQTQLYIFKKPNVCFLLMFSLWCLFGFYCGWLVVDQFRTSTRGSGYWVMWMSVDDIDLLNPTMVMHWHALCCVWFILVSVWKIVICVWDTWLTTFESSINYTLFSFQLPWWGWCVDLLLMMS